MAAGTHARALHIGADLATQHGIQLWAQFVAAEDAVQRTAAICHSLGISEQPTLVRDGATRSAVLSDLEDAAASLCADGLLVLTFSGHSVRGDGPIETRAGAAPPRLQARERDHRARQPRREMARIVDFGITLLREGDIELHVEPPRISFVAALRSFVEQWPRRSRREAFHSR